jgi:hypothetical protein
MNKTLICVCVILAIAISIVGSVILVKTSRKNSVNSTTSKNDSDNSTAAVSGIGSLNQDLGTEFKSEVIKIEKPREPDVFNTSSTETCINQGTQGKCVKKELCDNDSIQMTVKTDLKMDGNCNSEEANFICCPNNLITNNSKRKLLNKTCGTLSIDRIFGGDKAQPKEFPFFAALKYLKETTNKYTFKCGGSLITGEFNDSVKNIFMRLECNSAHIRIMTKKKFRPHFFCVFSTF